MDADANAEGTLLVNTVADNRSKYNNRNYSQAVLARQLQELFGRPSTQTCLRTIANNLIPNCPVTRKDVLAAEDIFGPDVGSLKGKTVRRPNTHIEGRVVDIPVEIMSRYREVIIGGDLMFVNKIPFFMTTSRHIKFGTVEALPNQTGKTIFAAIKKVKSVYMKRGFRMDGRFESLRGDLAAMGIALNTVSNDEHVPKIERYIRTTKERMHCVYNMLPF